MATVDPQQPIHERIKIVQKQLRVAIQNHQLLVVKHRVYPGDPDIKNSINVMQGLIISMGRTQSQLLAHFRKEMESSDQKNGAKVLLWPEIPKHIPVYERLVKQEDELEVELLGEGKKIGNWRTKKDHKKNLKSLLKVNSVRPTVNPGKKLRVTGGVKGTAERIVLENNSEIKIIYSKKGGEDSLLKHTKKQQSVLKSKSCEAKCEPSSDQEARGGGGGSKAASVGADGKRSSSDTLSDDMDCAELIPLLGPAVRRTAEPSPKPAALRKLQPNTLMKTKLRLRTRSGSFLRRDPKFDCDKTRDNMVSPSKSDVSGSPSPPRIGLTDDLNPNWVSIDDIGQDGFLRYFGLINREQYAAIKKKKCERKRRSVAGQSSYYNDYLQPLTPKRTYGPRKTASALATSQVVVETAMEVEDEDEKPRQNCTICHKNGNLEVCHSCSDTYHLKCVPNANSGCPTCHAQHSNIKNIVGANSASSASSMELIKRYLASSPDKNEVETNIEDTLQWSVVITAKPKL